MVDGSVVGAVKVGENLCMLGHGFGHVLAARQPGLDQLEGVGPVGLRA